MVLQCPACYSTEVEQHDATGDTMCTQCGMVLEESNIVSAVEFQETAGGASSVIGQYISATATRPYTSGGPGFGLSRESRELAIENGRRLIANLASRLHLNSHFVDSAHRLYILAIENRFTSGRKSSHVVAACLYIVCRREKSPHLLIDFADALATNVYALGATYVKFARLLKLNLPVIDPSLFIHRFAARMELGEATHAVSLTAMRLIQRMKRDWIETGRRPAGICGACLLIAARVHGFRRSIGEIQAIVKVTDLTLRNRLTEFENTSASLLTPEEFSALEDGGQGEEADEVSGGAADPPSFIRGLLEEEIAREAALLEDAYAADGGTGGAPFAVLGRGKKAAATAAAHAAAAAGALGLGLGGAGGGGDGEAALAIEDGSAPSQALVAPRQQSAAASSQPHPGALVAAFDGGSVVSAGGNSLLNLRPTVSSGTSRGLRAHVTAGVLSRVLASSGASSALANSFLISERDVDVHVRTSSGERPVYAFQKSKAAAAAAAEGGEGEGGAQPGGEAEDDEGFAGLDAGEGGGEAQAGEGFAGLEQREDQGQDEEMEEEEDAGFAGLDSASVAGGGGDESASVMGEGDGIGPGKARVLGILGTPAALTVAAQALGLPPAYLIAAAAEMGLTPLTQDQLRLMRARALLRQNWAQGKRDFQRAMGAREELLRRAVERATARHAAAEGRGAGIMADDDEGYPIALGLADLPGVRKGRRRHDIDEDEDEEEDGVEAGLRAARAADSAASVAAAVAGMGQSDDFRAAVAPGQAGSLAAMLRTVGASSSSSSSAAGGAELDPAAAAAALEEPYPSTGPPVTSSGDGATGRGKRGAAPAPRGSLESYLPPGGRAPSSRAAAAARGASSAAAATAPGPSALMSPHKAEAIAGLMTLTHSPAKLARRGRGSAAAGGGRALALEAQQVQGEEEEEEKSLGRGQRRRRASAKATESSEVDDADAGGEVAAYRPGEFHEEEDEDEEDDGDLPLVASGHVHRGLDAEEEEEEEEDEDAGFARRKKGGRGRGKRGASTSKAAPAAGGARGRGGKARSAVAAAGSGEDAGIIYDEEDAAAEGEVGDSASVMLAGGSRPPAAHPSARTIGVDELTGLAPRRDLVHKDAVYRSIATAFASQLAAEAAGGDAGALALDDGGDEGSVVAGGGGGTGSLCGASTGHISNRLLYDRIRADRPVAAPVKPAEAFRAAGAHGQEVLLAAANADFTFQPRGKPRRAAATLALTENGEEEAADGEGGAPAASAAAAGGEDGGFASLGGGGAQQEEQEEGFGVEETEEGFATAGGDGGASAGASGAGFFDGGHGGADEWEEEQGFAGVGPGGGGGVGFRGGDDGPVDTLSDLDDDDGVDEYLLPEEEAGKRVAIWQEIHGDFLEARARAREESERKKTAAKEPGAGGGNVGAKKRQFVRTRIEGDTAGESATKLVMRKSNRVSSKVNKAALQSLSQLFDKKERGQQGDEEDEDGFAGMGGQEEVEQEEEVVEEPPPQAAPAAPAPKGKKDKGSSSGSSSKNAAVTPQDETDGFASMGADAAAAEPEPAAAASAKGAGKRKRAASASSATDAQDGGDAPAAVAAPKKGKGGDSEAGGGGRKKAKKTATFAEPLDDGGTQPASSSSSAAAAGAAAAGSKGAPKIAKPGASKIARPAGAVSAAAAAAAAAAQQGNDEDGGGDEEEGFVYTNSYGGASAGDAVDDYTAMGGGGDDE